MRAIVTKVEETGQTGTAVILIIGIETIQDLKGENRLSEGIFLIWQLVCG